jgi:hypothetical protein
MLPPLTSTAVLINSMNSAIAGRQARHQLSLHARRRPCAFALAPGGEIRRCADDQGLRAGGCIPMAEVATIEMQNRELFAAMGNAGAYFA